MSQHAPSLADVSTSFDFQSKGGLSLAQRRLLEKRDTKYSDAHKNPQQKLYTVDQRLFFSTIATLECFLKTKDNVEYQKYIVDKMYRAGKMTESDLVNFQMHW